MLLITPFGSTDTKKIVKMAWLTDLHLDAAKSQFFKKILSDLTSLDPDLILIGGDLCNGNKALHYLLHIKQVLNKKIYFVLGNHEYYHHSIAEVRKLAQETAEYNENLHYLSASTIIPLTQSTALIGHDGWSDAKAGNFLSSKVSLHDYHLIKELSDLPRPKLMKKLHLLGEEAAHKLEKDLDEALKTYNHIVILTHTPPFQAACIYDKHISDDNWAPHFVCKSMGDMLIKKMNEHPQCQVLVLAGHAHHWADIMVLPNLRVIVGESSLGSPQIQAMIQL